MSKKITIYSSIIALSFLSSLCSYGIYTPKNDDINNILNSNLIIPNNISSPNDGDLKSSYILDQNLLSIINLVSEKHITKEWDNDPKMPVVIPPNAGTYLFTPYDSLGQYDSKDLNHTYQSINVKNNIFHDRYHNQINDFLTYTYKFLGDSYNTIKGSATINSSKTITKSINRVNSNDSKDYSLHYLQSSSTTTDVMPLNDCINNIFELLSSFIGNLSHIFYPINLDLEPGNDVNLDNLDFFVNKTNDDVNNDIANLLNSFLYSIIGFNVTNNSNQFIWVKYSSSTKSFKFAVPNKILGFNKNLTLIETEYANLPTENKLYLLFQNMLEEQGYIWDEVWYDGKKVYAWNPANISNDPTFSNNIANSFLKIYSREGLTYHYNINKPSVDGFDNNIILSLFTNIPNNYEYWNDFLLAHDMDSYSEFLLKINKISYDVWYKHYNIDLTKYNYLVNDEFWAHSEASIIDPKQMYFHIPVDKNGLGLSSIIAITVGCTIVACLSVLLIIYLWKNRSANILYSKKNYKHNKHKNSGGTTLE